MEEENLFLLRIWISTWTWLGLTSVENLASLINTLEAFRML